LESRKRLGFIVNPIAGIGGRVGLKGSDGLKTLRKAMELGAEKTAPARAVEALKRIAPIKDQIELITYPHEMGENEARECSFKPVIIGSIKSGRTTSEDTVRAAREMLELGVELILFAGGDGTARDIYEAVDGKVPVLGIPAGVKIHSGVYAVNPASAGELAAKFLLGETSSIRESEVMDIDEEAFREDRVSARLYGYLKVPYMETLVQSSKEASRAQEKISMLAIASDVVENMQDDYIYLVGPGTTTRAVFNELGLEKTLLGVDIVQKGRLVASDVNESKILELIRRKKAKILVTVIGGQGFVFGRGNQQISPIVIREVGRENVEIVATPDKLASLKGKPLLVDTGDPEVDEMLSGYHKVVTGYKRRVVYMVKSPFREQKKS